MKREIIKTSDGSVTIHLSDWNEQYHSKHGAIQEAQHVFLKMGLYEHFELKKADNVNILEIGFGTGLNAFLTLLESEKMGINVNYIGVEAYPVSAEEIVQLNYAEAAGASHRLETFKSLHDTEWEKCIHISDHFQLTKQKKTFDEVDDKKLYDLIYFDAFGARVQPELWTEAIFGIMYKALVEGGILVTYAAKGSVRRAMIASGFQVEKLPGPPGKREMLRAVKK